MQRDAEGTGSSGGNDDEVNTRKEEDSGSGVVEDFSQQARDELGRLEQGRHVTIPGADVPIRGLVAMGIFVVAFMAVWMLLWAVAGGAGLGLGWIPAALVAGAVVVLYARRA
ncbi:MAG: hypothetical protein ACR2G3_07285 [Solirubrobacterales bacterium]